MRKDLAAEQTLRTPDSVRGLEPARDSTGGSLVGAKEWARTPLADTARLAAARMLGVLALVDTPAEAQGLVDTEPVVRLEADTAATPVALAERFVARALAGTGPEAAEMPEVLAPVDTEQLVAKLARPDSGPQGLA